MIQGKVEICGVNTSKLNRLEQFVAEFADNGSHMTGEQLHTHLDEIEQVHGLYSPLMLGLAAALACGAYLHVPSRVTV